MNKRTEEAARLRGPHDQRVANPGPPSLDCQWVPGASIVVHCVPEERDHIARRCEAKAKDQRILGGVDELVDVVGIKAVPEANLGRARNTGKGDLRTVGKAPRIAWH